MPPTPRFLPFSKLSPKARETAIEGARYAEVEYEDWYQDTKNDFVGAATLKGFDIDDCRFSGFSCQGSGASFKGSVDIEIALRAHRLSNQHRKALAAAKRGDISARIGYSSSNYCHSNTMTIDLDWPDCPDDEIFQRLENDLLCAAREAADGFYKSLDDLYDDLTSDETVADRLESLDRLYDATGHEVDDEADRELDELDEDELLAA